MKKYLFNDIEYVLIKDDGNIFNYEDVVDMVTDYFSDFDYIFFDMAYNKLRLKGFYDSKNKKCSSINDINDLEKYIKNYCATGCKWFILKKCS